jgi:hypothetical protein
MDLRTQLQVFPNSGHHFHFVRLSPEHLAEHPELAAVCARRTCPWAEARGEDGEAVHWIRGRLSTRTLVGASAGDPGVLLSIETNLGRTNRGWVYRPREKLEAQREALKENGSTHWTPYAYADVADVPSAPASIRFRLCENAVSPPLEIWIDLELSWLTPAAHPIDVDLIVDFGNTRTLVVGLEHNQASGGLLSQICRPIKFGTRADELVFDGQARCSTEASMIDSWFVLHEPLFANLEDFNRGPSQECMQLVRDVERRAVRTGIWPFTRAMMQPVAQTLRVPQAHVQLSPALLGTEAWQMLTQLPVQAGGNFMLSSPKRYIWDQDPVGHLGQTGQTFWTMYLYQWNSRFHSIEDPNRPEMLPKLVGTVLHFLDQSGEDWTLGPTGEGTPPNERTTAAARPVANPDEPNYPRGDALTWAALTILETAYRNIMSDEWRRALGQPFVQRRLRSITITYPPGWTHQEVSAYRQKWQKAVDIFTLAHLNDRRLVTHGGDRPLVHMDVDEAVASQLPLVFGEIKSLGNEGENWISLVGRGEGLDSRVRIMNIDIGGGTTDVAIIEYKDDFEGPGVHLTTTLLYRDSSTIAGDALVRRAIEAVLLPTLARGMQEQEFIKLDGLLRSAKQESARWRRITRQMFIPIVYRWLQDLAANRYHQPATTAAPTAQDVLGQGVGVIHEFNRLCTQAGVMETNLLNPTSPLYYEPKKLQSCIIETFAELFRSLAKVVEAFDCDLVFVSGKPSELPPLRKMLEESVPLLPQRVIFAKDTQVGFWYPLGAAGTIPDAKATAVAGATLFQAIRNGLISHWEIRRQISPSLPKRNYWGMMPEVGRTDFGRLYLAPEQDENKCSIMIGTRIGRRLLPSRTRPEPVYQLRWRNPARYRGGRGSVTVALEVILRRMSPAEPGDNEEQRVPAEYLEIVEAKGALDGVPVNTNDVELRLCTLDSEDYWMDACIFVPEWPHEASATR